MRSLSIFALLVASSSLSSAAIISSVCTPSVGSGSIGTYAQGAGTVTYACAGFAAPSNQQIIAITLDGRADYQFGGNGPNSFQVSFAVPSGFSVNPVLASASGNNSSGLIVPYLSTLNTGLPTLSYANFNVVGIGSTTEGSVASGSGFLQVSYTYEAIPQTGDVPEPSTIALVGGVLVLAGLRKLRS